MLITSVALLVSANPRCSIAFPRLAIDSFLIHCNSVASLVVAFRLSAFAIQFFSFQFHCFSTPSDSSRSHSFAYHFLALPFHHGSGQILSTPCHCSAHRFIATRRHSIAAQFLASIFHHGYAIARILFSHQCLNGVDCFNLFPDLLDFCFVVANIFLQFLFKLRHG